MTKDEHRGKDSRKARLAQKLRENLRRRKAQIRERKESGGEGEQESPDRQTDEDRGPACITTPD